MSYASWVRRLRWPILIAWLSAAVLTLTFLPNLAQVVAHTSPSFLPASSSVSKAGQLLSRIDPGTGHKSTAIIAVVRPHGLTNSDLSWFDQRLTTLAAHEQRYGVSLVQDAQNSPRSVQSSFVSRSGTTEIALIGFPGSDVSSQTKAAYQDVQGLFARPPSGSSLYFTGDVPIQTDNINISLSGTERTAVVTVLLVLVILVLILRSVIAPLVNLMTIGLSFLISSGLVAWLAGFGFPVSTFTQTFMIGILFGAGTDYSIIMLNRFREELTHAHHEDVTAAIAASLRAVGRTVAFSAATVGLSFAVLLFAHFGLYRSAVGVAVGVVITLAACLTLIPALMAIFGRSLFWPRPPVVGVAHRQSRLWTATSRTAVRHPWWTMAAMIAILTPIALLFSGVRSFNTLADIPQAPSVHGFNAVAKAFGEGSIMPVQIVLETTGNLRTPSGLASIEDVAQALAAAPHVTKVYAATRPEGTVLQQFQLSYQDGQAASGLRQIEGGLSSLQNGLGSAGRKISASGSGTSQLQNGAQQLAGGATKLSTGASSLSSGAGRLAAGAKSLTSALTQLHDGAQAAAGGANGITQGLGASEQGAAGVSGGLKKLSSSEQQLSSLAQALSQSLGAWAAAHPGTSTDPNWQAIVQEADQLSKGTGATQQATGTLAAGAGQVTDGLTKLDSGSKTLSISLGSIAGGAASTARGAQSLGQGASALSSGAAKLSSGAGSLASGASRLSQGVQQATSGASQLQGGLSSAAGGTKQLLSGTQQIESALSSATSAATTGNPGFYLPSSQMQNSNLVKAMQPYISADGHIAEFNVDLSLNPYSPAAIAEVPHLTGIASGALLSTPVHSGHVYATGTSALQSNLNQISGQDFVRTISLVLIVIFLLLAFMLRSVLSPVYILLSLIGGYFVTMGIVQSAVESLLHVVGVDWTTPFFTLLLLVALGVDYSIFLMSRFEEIRREGKEPEEAIQEAMGRMGNVIFSAAVIMAGTFGSMALSGVTGLVEIGGSIVVGLLIYTTVMLGLFVPAAIAVVGGAHHWPLVRVRADVAQPAPSLD